MDRQTVYPGQIPYETDILSAERFAYEALGLAMKDIVGGSTIVSGFACTATSPASLSVNVAPGRIYSVEHLDASSWGNVDAVGGLAADTNSDHDILKQGLLRDTTNLTVAAPGTVGQSVNYLVQVAFSETDDSDVVLPYFNATTPSSPWSGPSNTGNTQPTIRADHAVVSVKAGTAATTGTQTTPAPDAGYVGLWVITVANGQTTVTSGNIALYSAAPFLDVNLGGVPGAIQNQTFTGFDDTGAANAYVITPVPAITAYAKYQRFQFKAANANTGASTINVNGLGNKSITRRDGSALSSGDISANAIVDVEYDGSAFQLLSAATVGAAGTEALGADVVDDGSGNLTAAELTAVKTASYSIAAGDIRKHFYFNLSGAATATMPSAVTSGSRWSIKLSNLVGSTNNLTVGTSGGNFYGGALPNVSSFTLAPGESVTISSSGALWLVSAWQRVKATQTETNNGTANKFPDAAAAKAAIYSCKAWALLASNTTPTISAGYNIASATYSSNITTVTFSTPMSDANYSVSVSGETPVTSLANVIGVNNRTVNGFQLYVTNNGGGYSSMNNISIQVFGN